MVEGFQKVTLGNLAGGGAEEIFQRELKHVLENIDDPNFPAQAKRRITLTIEFRANEQRDKCEAAIHCKTTLAPPLAATMPVFFRRNLITKENEAIQFQAKQVDIFAQIEREAQSK